MRRRPDSFDFVGPRGALPGEPSECRGQRLECEACIGDDGNGGPVQAMHLRRVDVDAHRREPGRAPRGPVVPEAGADGEHRIGALPQPRAGRLGHRERMAVVEDPSTRPMGNDRGLQRLRHRAQRIPRMQRTAADHDDWVLGRCHQLRRILDGPGVRDRRCRSRHRFDLLDIRLESEHVHRRLDRDGAGHAGPELEECGAHPLRRLRRVLDAFGPLGEAAQDGELIGDFVQQPVALVDRVCGELSGDREHRCADPVGGGERRGGVQDAGPGNDDVGADLPGRLGVPEGHVGGGLLVAGVDHADPVAFVVQCVEQRVELDAGQPEHRVDAVRDERAHDSPGRGHPWHADLLEIPRAPRIFTAGPGLQRGLVDDEYEAATGTTRPESARSGVTLDVRCRSGAQPHRKRWRRLRQCRPWAAGGHPTAVSRLRIKPRPRGSPPDRAPRQARRSPP